ncbi:MAG: hypothetical protein IKA17_09610 [Clostridia bacterium]|nr:hypothetical protein [Clostridia bacterium]
MTLREKILKTFVVTIREINTHGGAEEFFKKYPVGGLYYGEEPAHVINGKYMGTQFDFETLNEIKKHSPKKLLVCADGCAIRNQTVMIGSQKSLGASRNLKDAYNWGKVLGMQMNDKGVDWILGPSIDMCFDPLMYLMAIGNDPKVIADIYREVVRGIQDQGVCATVKHFPGLGTNFVNMHIAPGKNVLSYDEWMKTYGYTYKEMFKANVHSVMTTHVTLRSYDNEGDNGFYPIATFSKKLTTDLLKGELGFDGAVVTDALIMGGNGVGDYVAETVQAFKAGADLLLWPPVEAAEVIEEKINSGEIPMSRLEDALVRIERMEKFRNDALENNSYDEPDARFVDETKIEISKNGMCLLRNDLNLIPLNTKQCKKALIVDITDDDDFSSNLLCSELINRGIQAEVKRDIYDKESLVCWQSDIEEIQSHYDFVIMNLNAHFVAQWSDAHVLIWASHHFDKKKKIIINYGSPYFASEYFPEDPTYIEANTTPTKETVGLIVDGLLGKMEFTGRSLL